MAVNADCQGCGRNYRLAENSAGKRFRCKECGEIVEAPSLQPRGRAPSRGRRTPEARRGRTRTGSSRARKRRPSKRHPAFLPAIVGGSIVAGGLLVFVAMNLLGGGATETNDTGSGDSGNAAASTDSTSGTATADQRVKEAGLTSSGVAAAELSDADKAAREQAYKEKLEASRRERANSSRKEMERRFGANQVVTVVFTDVVGDTDRAHKYLQRKVFRAAYAEYSADVARAQEKTRRNEEQAKRQALEQHNRTFGANVPGMVHYQYRRVDSKLPYPRTVNAGRIDNTFTYHVAPASNLQAFAQAVGVGTANVVGREIRIRAQLPTPIPDPDVEELVLKYGEEKVSLVRVTGGSGDPEAVEMWLRERVAGLQSEDKVKISIAGFEALGNGIFEFHLAPIHSEQVFIDGLSWGAGTIRSDHIEVAAQLPDPMPTVEGMRAAKAARQREEKAIRDADWNHQPRPGESQIEWAIRVMKDHDHWGIEKALNALALMDVDKESQQEVSMLLMQNVGKHGYGTKALLPAIAKWGDRDKVELILIQLLSEKRMSSDRTVVMDALAELKTPRAAAALSRALDDFFAADDSVRFLTKMGSVAETPVLAYIKHKDAKVRNRVYTILLDIGTSKSLPKLRANVKLENNAAMKATAETCYEAVRDRVKADKEASGDAQDK